MIKDLGNQRLPRFKAGQPILEQVTAERLNDICTMIEACRVQPGYGYMINRTSGGTSLSVNIDELRPPRLWKIAFEDVNFDPISKVAELIEELLNDFTNVVRNPNQFKSIFNSFLDGLSGSFQTGNAGSGSGTKNAVERIFSPIFALIERVDAFVQEKLGDIMPIRSTLENYFDNLGRFPRDGDYIYTDEFGIIYTTFKETEEKGVKFPKENLMFRVKFTLGKSEDSEGVNFYAMTTFPNPDIASIVKMLLTAFVNFISNLFGAIFEGLISAMLNSIAKALHFLFEFLMELIENLQELINSLFEAFENLKNAFNNLDIPSLSGVNEKISSLKAQLDTLEKLLKGELDESGNKIKGELEKINDLIKEAKKEIEDLIENAVPLKIIAEDGKSHEIKVFEDKVGEDKRKEITWIDSNNGVGHRAKSLIWDEQSPNVQDVDWRFMEFIGANGTSYTAPILTRPNEVNENGKASPATVTVCDGSNEAKKTFVEIHQ